MYRAERYESGGPLQYSVTGIEDDMGRNTTMDLLIQGDGDAVVTLRDKTTGQELSMEICTSQGGTHTPGAALGFRDLSEFLYNLQHDPEYLRKRIMQQFLGENS